MHDVLVPLYQGCLQRFGRATACLADKHNWFVRRQLRRVECREWMIDRARQVTGSILMFLPHVDHMAMSCETSFLQLLVLDRRRTGPN